MFKSDKSIPLCVDLDGTLIKEDTSLLLLKQFIMQDTTNIFKLIFWYCKTFSNAYIKEQLAKHCILDISKLTFSTLVQSLIKKAAQEKRKICLVTGTNYKIAQKINEHVIELDDYFASTIEINLVAKQKANSLVAKFGEHGYIYIGNSTQDFPVWDKALGVIVSPFASSKVATIARKKYKNVMIL